MRHFLTATVLVLSAASVFQAATVGDTPPVVTKFLDLFDRLRAAQEKNSQGGEEHVSFKLTETEINEYLRYSLKTTPRPGLDSLTVKFFANDYVSTFTRVDFDAVEKWHPGTVPAVLRPILKGKKAIWIDFRIHADNSQLTFNVEKARYEDMTLPPLVVEKMIQIVAARQPEKYDTSKPVPLPFGLRKVWTGAQFVQGHN